MSLFKKKEKYQPELYTEEELDALEAHIETHFGAFESVFHEIASPDLHIDIAIIEPTPARNYYTLVTMGMGAHRMNLPEKLRGKGLERAEIMTFLPPDWKVSNGDEQWYWPLRWLKTLARLPGEENSWIGWGHSATNGGSFAENTSLSEVLLFSPWAKEGETATACQLPDGGTVNFFQMVPIYPEELTVKQAHGAEALLDLWGEDFSPVLDLTRKNYGLEEPRPAV